MLLFSVSEAFEGGRHLSIYILLGREPLDGVVLEQMDGARPCRRRGRSGIKCKGRRRGATW